MKSFESNLTTELAKEAAAVFVLLKLELNASTIRYTDCDAPIYDTGESQSYVSRGLRLIGSTFGEGVDSVEVELVTIDQVVSALFMAEDVRGRDATFKVAAIGTDYKVVADPDTLFKGEIDGWQLTEQNSLRIKIVSEMVHWQKKCMRRAQPDCPWPFKGTECGYSGSETWCDQTYRRCTDLANTDNFGGFRWLPSIIEAKPIWGAEVKIPRSGGIF